MKKSVFTFGMMVMIVVGAASGQSLPPSSSKTEKLLEANALLIEASSEKNKGNFQKAMDLYAKCLRLPGEKSAIHYEIAQLQYDEFKNYDQALKHISKALDIDQSNYWYLIFYIKINKENNYPYLVERAYKQLMSNHPTNQEIVLDFAEFYIEKKQYEKALLLYEALEKQIGVSEHLNKNKFLIYRGLGKYEKAIDEANKLIQAFPKDEENYLELINLHRSLQNKTEVERNYKKALQALPNSSMIADDYAHHLFTNNKMDSAFFYHKKAMQDPDYELKAKMEIIEQYLKFEKVDSSLKTKRKDLIKILESNVNSNFESNQFLGNVFYSIKDFSSAQAYSLKAVDEYKNSYETWQQLILSDFELKQYTNMYLHCEQAMDVFPAQSELYYYGGIAFVEQEKFQEASEVFLQGLSFTNIKSLKVQFYSSLGDAFHSLKNDAESDKYYELALSLDSNNAFVLNNFAYYLSERKLSLDKAAYLSSKSIQLNPTTYSFLDTYGWILYQKESYDKALEYLLQAESFGGDKSPIIMEHIGDVYYKIRQNEKANTYWQKALELGGKAKELKQKIRGDK